MSKAYLSMCDRFNLLASQLNDPHDQPTLRQQDQLARALQAIEQEWILDPNKRQI